MPNHFEIKNLLLFSQPNTLFPHTVCIAVLYIKVNVFLKEHVTQAGRNRDKDFEIFLLLGNQIVLA